MHWAKQSRIERIQFARTTNDPERRAAWVELAKKHHRIYLHDKRENDRHIAWLREKEARHIASGQLVTAGIRSLLELEEEYTWQCCSPELCVMPTDLGLGDRPASHELIATDLVMDVMGVLG